MLQAQVHREKTSTGCKPEHTLLLAFGSNLTSTFGSPADNVQKALDKITQLGASIAAVSRFYATPAFPPGSGADFVNAAACVSSKWTVEEALAHCHQIEADLGRERAERWGARTLDIDLIGYEDVVLPDAQTHRRWQGLNLQEQLSEAPDEIILPHPRVQERAFVLVPLADVAPDWVHPLLGKSVREMLAALDPSDVAEVKPLQ